MSQAQWLGAPSPSSEVDEGHWGGSQTSDEICDAEIRGTNYGPGPQPGQIQAQCMALHIMSYLPAGPPAQEWALERIMCNTMMRTAHSNQAGRSGPCPPGRRPPRWIWAAIAMASLISTNGEARIPGPAQASIMSCSVTALEARLGLVAHSGSAHGPNQLGMERLRTQRMARTAGHAQ